jgi:hypothetical protein
MLTPTTHSRPTVSDWLLLIVGLMFVVAGLIILPRKPDVGIVTLAFFGSCTGVFVATILRKLRYGRFRAKRAEVIGGVPIYPSRLRAVLLGGWMFVLGVILFVFGSAYPSLFRWLAVFVALVGAGLLFGVFIGRLPAGFMQFDPDALTLGQRGWHARIPWSEIAEIAEGEIHGNPTLFLWLRNIHAVDVQPPSAQVRAEKRMLSSMTWLGAHFAIMASQYGIDLPVLAAAVRCYVADPTARAELDRHSLPEKI